MKTRGSTARQHVFQSLMRSHRPETPESEDLHHLRELFRESNLRLGKKRTIVLKDFDSDVLFKPRQLTYPRAWDNWSSLPSWIRKAIYQLEKHRVFPTLVDQTSRDRGDRSNKIPWAERREERRDDRAREVRDGWSGRSWYNGSMKSKGPGFFPGKDGKDGKGAYQRDDGKGAYQRDDGKGAYQRDDGKGAYQRDDGKGAYQRDDGKGAYQRDLTAYQGDDGNWKGIKGSAARGEGKGRAEGKGLWQWQSQAKKLRRWTTRSKGSMARQPLGLQDPSVAVTQ